MNIPKQYKLCNIDKIEKYDNWYILLKWQNICDKKCFIQDFGGNTSSKNNKWEHILFQHFTRLWGEYLQQK